MEKDLPENESPVAPLIVAGVLLVFASLACCFGGARIALGTFSGEGSRFGISPGNFPMVTAASIFLIMIAGAMLIPIGRFIEGRVRWLLLIPAAVIPILGGFCFSLLLALGLG